MDAGFDFSTLARAGSAIAEMADKLDLSTAETSRAIVALLPAFSIAYQRAAADPERFKAALSSAMPAGDMDDDRERLTRVFFGRDDLARAVIDQAARTSGLGAEVVHTLFPAMAADLATSLSRQSQLGTAGDLMVAFLRGYARGRSGTPGPVTFNPWLDAMSAFTEGFMRGQTPDDPAARTAPFAPFTTPDMATYQQLFDQFMPPPLKSGMDRKG
ncbi:DUF937 domain-containing protein [Amorphus orientalis]|uniref:DUF937 domain-containing protein n=1 Tax=Amorphus orientalis TaxID=649198 RepID=A0AAE3VRW9_9HYPH|nr:DUF937 domain-containing protein [Amorphus orientalis]MDQ0316536.1 hypothetical protein [Amorphus orientalis]